MKNNASKTQKSTSGAGGKGEKERKDDHMI